MRKNTILILILRSVLFVLLIILNYDPMSSEIDFTPEKSFSVDCKNSQLLLTAAAVTKRSDGGIAKPLKALKMHF